jgi:sarcosine oxidase subunit gamma
LSRTAEAETTANSSEAAVAIEELGPRTRFSLRCRPASTAALSGALVLELPDRIGERFEENDREVVCLGPDEWMILTSEAGGRSIVDALAPLRESHPHSLTDISDREVSLRLTGTDALTLLSLGCPRDLSKLVVGRAVRTVFDGVTVIVWRDEPESFRLDAWRSFMPHVRELLEISVRELRAGL